MNELKEFQCRLFKTVLDSNTKKMIT